MAKNRRFQVPNLTFQTTQLTFTPVDIDENMGTAHMYGRIVRRIKNPLPYGSRARDNDKFTLPLLADNLADGHAFGKCYTKGVVSLA